MRMDSPLISSPAKTFVSIVIPCLNEGQTLRMAVEEARDAFSDSRFDYEIIVADNGSTDDSPAIAKNAGARVVNVPVRGYGAALQAGFQAAAGSVLVFGDADFSYDFRQAPALVERLLEGTSAMVMGTRLRGTVEAGAMPLLHRYLGTPTLTALINILFGSHLTDCNSGLRALYRDRYREWNVSSHGMEFASELIVNCLKAGGQINEIPITLRKDRRLRAPHLHTWRDGMRHLLFILSRAPQGFSYIGFVFLIVSLFAALPAAIIGPLPVRGVILFDYHTFILATLVGFLGCQAISYGVLLDVPAKNRLKANRWLLDISEVRLFQIMLAWGLLIALSVGFIVLTWMFKGLRDIHYLRLSLFVLYGTVVIGSLGAGLIFAHIYQRTPTSAGR